jgi:uncharacterized integral membrane protein
MTKFVQTTYGWLATAALALGFLVALVFLIAVLVGGDTGVAMALFGGEVMEIGIIIATIAVAGGLIWMYVSGNHSLKWEKSTGPNAGPTDDDQPKN